ncbi:Guanine nucleotide-binding protein subunit beta-like protein [Bienertia sinuspersici]
MWDFSKGRPFLVVDFVSNKGHNGAYGSDCALIALFSSLPLSLICYDGCQLLRRSATILSGNVDETSRNTGQFYNPAFVHAIAIPDIDMLDKLGKTCAVARGDGIVSLINIEAELAAVKSKGATKPRKNSVGGSSSAAKGPDAETKAQNELKRLHLDYTLGGHTAAASCVSFSSFGEKGKFIISGGNDKSVKVWDWSRYLDEAQPSEDAAAVSSINLPKKVNWLCTTPTDSENLVVCDTSKVIKVYTLALG